jgi:hypothetical protein
MRQLEKKELSIISDLLYIALGALLYNWLGVPALEFMFGCIAGFLFCVVIFNKYIYYK